MDRRIPNVPEPDEKEAIEFKPKEYPYFSLKDKIKRYDYFFILVFTWILFACTIQVANNNLLLGLAGIVCVFLIRLFSYDSGYRARQPEVDEYEKKYDIYFHAYYNLLEKTKSNG